MAANFKKRDAVVCVTTEGFHNYPNMQHPQLYGLYVIERVLSDGAVIVEGIDNSRFNITPVSSDLDIVAFWPWHFKKVVGLRPKNTFNSNGCETDIHELTNIEI